MTGTNEIREPNTARALGEVQALAELVKLIKGSGLLRVPDPGPILAASSSAIGDLVGALAKAQGAIELVTKSKTADVKSKRTGAEFQYSYADLGQVLQVARQPLADNELAIIQRPMGQQLETLLAHSSGQWITSVIPLLVHQGATPQEYGSGLTYARRYALGSMLGIGMEDDDGARADQAAQDQRQQHQQQRGGQQQQRGGSQQQRQRRGSTPKSKPQPKKQTKAQLAKAAKAKAKAVEEWVAKQGALFQAVQVTVEQVESYLGHKLQDSSKAEARALKGVAAMMLDGDATWADFEAMGADGTSEESMNLAQALEAKAKAISKGGLAPPATRAPAPKADEPPPPPEAVPGAVAPDDEPGDDQLREPGEDG